uniref:Uncharacterized protein n=1 Tax=Streptomyces sp. NBC_01401 TaxID=2903854 RepID=A0AAU3GR40_9ACTN
MVSVGFGDYDHTRDLWTGQVTAPGCELECTVVPTPEETFSRFLEGGEWDAAARRGRVRRTAARLLLPPGPHRPA